MVDLPLKPGVKTAVCERKSTKIKDYFRINYPYASGKSGSIVWHGILPVSV